MGWLFAGFYIVPAAVGALGFWALWRLTRLIELGSVARRVLFGVLGALVFAPMLVPAGTIFVAWVPHFLLLAEPDVDYYIRLARYVVPSLVLTAAVFWFVGRWVVSSATLKLGWATPVLPILALVLVVGIYRYAFPSHDLARSVDPVALEALYGERLDQVIALLNIDDDAERQTEIARLHSAFQSDASVLRVTLQDPDVPYPSYGGTFYHLNVDSPPSESCSSDGPNRMILMRCTWSYGALSRRDTLKYKRSFIHKDASLEVILDLDYKNALEAVERRR